MPPLQFLVSMPDREPELEVLVGGSMVVATIRVLHGYAGVVYYQVAEIRVCGWPRNELSTGCSWSVRTLKVRTYKRTLTSRKTRVKR